MLVHSKEFMSKKTVGAVNKARTENWLILVDIYKGAGIAQLAERPTEKPGATLTRVRVPGAARAFSPRVNLNVISTTHYSQIFLQPSARLVTGHPFNRHAIIMTIIHPSMLLV